MTYKLLIVDDEMPNLRLLERLFSHDFHCLTASSGADAIRLLEQHDVAILISDQRMPQMTGIELLKKTARLRPHMVRILLTGYTDVEVLVEAINSGLVYMYVTKPWNNNDLRFKVSRARDHYESNKQSSALTLANNRLVARLNEMKLRIVTGLSEMLRARDEQAYGHTLRVRHYAMAIAERMGLGEEEKENLAAAALLHDLGGVAILGNGQSHANCSVTNKTTVARAYSECEARLLTSIPELGAVADLVRLHRENFDGTGFPTGLRGHQIPVPCRLLRLADEYDLMIRPKASVAPMKHDEAMRFLIQRSGKQFDPKVIEIMSQLRPEDLVDPQAPASSAITDSPSETTSSLLMLTR